MVSVKEEDATISATKPWKKVTVWAAPGWFSKNQTAQSGSIQTTMGKYITVFDSTIIKVVTSSDYATPSAQEYSPLALALQDPRCEIELGVGFVTLGSIAKAMQLLPEYVERSETSITCELGH